MKKKILCELNIVLGTCVIVAIGIYLLIQYFDTEIEQMYTKTIERTYGDQTKYVLNKSISEGNVLLLGSSELSSPVEQNPVYMYPNSKLNLNVTIDGQAYVQSLSHTMKVASIEKNDPEKVCLIASLQWFMGEDIDTNGFGAHFSQLQFMDLVSSDKISDENKRYVCQRVVELLGPVNGYEDIKVFALLEQSENTFAKIAKVILKPYYKMKYFILEFRDKYKTYEKLKSLEAIPDSQYEKGAEDLEWDIAMQKAGEEGRQSCTNNDFFVEDEYYETYLKERITELKDMSKEAKLFSKEREDFRHFLSICKDLGIRPYIIMMNTNGYYYDYIGIDREKRNELYQWVKEQTEEQGFDCLIMSEMEYEPYFMRDVMHLGWKGWLYVNEKISEYYSQN